MVVSEVRMISKEYFTAAAPVWPEVEILFLPSCEPFVTQLF